MSIVLNNITKKFGGKTVIRNFSASFAKGSRTALIASSGSGKTTLFRIICGLDKRFDGECSVNGRAAVMFQEDRLFENSTVLENVLCVNEAQAEKASLLLSELGLADTFNQYPSALSGGMKRRVALARALLYDGEAVLLDECFTGLDDETKVKTAEVINKYTAGKTLLVITHDKDDARLLGCEINEITFLK